MHRDDSSARITHAVSTAMEMLPDAEAVAGIEAHGRWMMGQVMKQLKPSDLNIKEVLGLLAILGPAHNRKLALSGSPCGIPLVFVDPETGRRWDFQNDRLN